MLAIESELAYLEIKSDDALVANTMTLFEDDDQVTEVERQVKVRVG